MRDVKLTLFIAVYWFLGGYLIAAITPYALQSGLVCLIIGLLLLRWVFAIEDRGGQTPMILGCALFAPPLTLILFGVVWGILIGLQG